MKEKIKNILTYLHIVWIVSLLKQQIKMFQKSWKINKVNQQWKELNKHNFTRVANGIDDLLFPISKVKVGNYTYGKLKVYSYFSNDENEGLKIGSFCSIANDVTFILGGMHHTNKLTTYPMLRYCFYVKESFSKGHIIVEDDVWIGQGATILSGVTLKKGTVVAAGSVVVKSTEPYSVVGGNPAKLIKKRFSDDIINELINLDLNNLSFQTIKENKELFLDEINLENVEKIKILVKNGWM